MSAPPSQRLPNWHQVWAVLATGLPLAILAVGCLNAQRVPPDTARRPSQQAPARPTIEPTGAARNKTPSSWKPLKTVRKWNSIVLHHTATEAGSVASIHANHLQRTTGGKPWLGIGYHFVIGNGVKTTDGKIYVGDRWKRQIRGGHLASSALNEVAIGICLVGNFEKTQPTAKQRTSLKALVSLLRKRTGVPYSQVRTHRHITPKPTICPGRRFNLRGILST